MRKTLLSSLVLPFVLACEPEITPPTPPGQICFPVTGQSLSEFGDDCAVQECSPTTVALKSAAANDAFTCASTSCAKASESDDVISSGFVYVELNRADFIVLLQFARAVLDEPLTLSSLRKHLQGSKINTSQVGLPPAGAVPSGGAQLINTSIVLDDLVNGVLTFHGAGDQNVLLYVTSNATPHLCSNAGPLPTLCTVAHCSYTPAPGANPAAIDVRVSGTAQFSVLVP